MSVTESYSLMHEAFAVAARDYKVEPTVARVVYALHERGGEGTSHDLDVDLWLDASGVRRALLTMYANGLATGIGVDGKRRRPGTLTLVTLTVSGQAMARRISEVLGALRNLATYPVAA